MTNNEVLSKRFRVGAEFVILALLGEGVVQGNATEAQHLFATELVELLDNEKLTQEQFDNWLEKWGNVH